MPGVRVVVDAGLSRVPRADLSRGLGSLVTVRASRAAVTQRAGRAGREGPGAVYRCWTAAEHDRLAAHDEPEVAIADLTAFALELACWGAPGGRGLALLDPPPAAALAVAEQTLRGLGAVDDEGRATDRGRALTAVGRASRLARALLDGAPLVGRRRAAEVVALLSGDTSFRSDDLGAAWRSLRDGADRGATARWRDEVGRLERAAADAAAPRLPDDTAAGLVVGLAHPERLARRRPGGTGTYLMAAGTGAELSPGTALTGAPWLAIAVADRSPGRRDARVRAAVAIDEATALEAGAALHLERDEVTWRDGDVSSARVERLGAIVLTERPLPDPDPADVAAAVAEGLRLEGLGLLRWTPAAIAAAGPAGRGTRRTGRSVAGRRRRDAARRDRRVGRPQPGRPHAGWTSSRPCARSSRGRSPVTSTTSSPSGSRSPPAPGSGSTTPIRTSRRSRCGCRRCSAGRGRR